MRLNAEIKRLIAEKVAKEIVNKKQKPLLDAINKYNQELNNALVSVTTDKERATVVECIKTLGTSKKHVNKIRIKRNTGFGYHTHYELIGYFKLCIHGRLACERGNENSRQLIPSPDIKTGEGLLWLYHAKDPFDCDYDSPIHKTMEALAKKVEDERLKIQRLINEAVNIIEHSSTAAKLIQILPNVEKHIPTDYSRNMPLVQASSELVTVLQE